jgi:AcrR family transcriptional regulator
VIPFAADPVVLRVDATFYIKDPTTTALGRDIVGQGIVMIAELGYEAFTFRKLAERIGTTEASVYRYFKSKHRFLAYLIAWYWTWMEHRVLYATVNIADPRTRLQRALHELTRRIERDDGIPHVDEEVLYQVVVAESSKVYLHRDVSAENRDGLFLGYKRVCRMVADMISAVDPSYQYPVALVSTVVESSHLQRFFSEHLPRLTDVDHERADASTSDFLCDLVFRAVRSTN